MRVDLLRLIGRDTELKRSCARHGGEYAGACPLCRRGTDRFRVWPAARALGLPGRRGGAGRLRHRRRCRRLPAPARWAELHGRLRDAGHRPAPAWHDGTTLILHRASSASVAS